MLRVTLLTGTLAALVLPPAAGEWAFALSAAGKRQQSLFGSAARQGWLGGENPTSFRLKDNRYIWMFGDSLVNVTSGSDRQAAAAATEGSEPASQCNFFPSASCAMPTNTFALWEGDSEEALSFHAKLDHRTLQPTSMLWPPGFGGAGRGPKEPSCESCTLWRDGTALGQTSCAARGARVLEDQGGCCSGPAGPGACAEYCCHSELYLRPGAGVVLNRSDGGEHVLIMAGMARSTMHMPDAGKVFGTYAVVVRNAGVQVPIAWRYESAEMPGTEVWPWSEPDEIPQFHSAIAHGEADDKVYLLGSLGDAKVLARASLDGLIYLEWGTVEYLSSNGTWKPYDGAGDGVPALLPLWRSSFPASSLHFDSTIGRWCSFEARDDSESLVLRAAESLEGPYEAWDLGRLPEDLMKSPLNDWDIISVQIHPELAVEGCQWTLSLNMRWRPVGRSPPKPGLHNFPRLLCVSVRLAVPTTTTVPPPTTTTVPPTTTPPPPTTSAPTSTSPSKAKATTKVASTATSMSEKPVATLAPPFRDGLEDLEHASGDEGKHGKHHENNDAKQLAEQLTGHHKEHHDDEASTRKTPEKNCEVANITSMLGVMACNDTEGGCFTCSERAKWLVGQGQSMEAAYGWVVTEFPEDCGGIAPCMDELTQMNSLGQAWLRHPVVPPATAPLGAFRVSLGLLTAFCLVGTSAGFAVGASVCARGSSRWQRWRRLERDERELGYGAGEYDLSEMPPLLLEIE